MELNRKRKLFLISNMYPSKENVRYGIFVKNFEEAINRDYEVNRIVLTKKTNKLNKIFGYTVLYYKIFKLLFKTTKKDIIYVHFPLHVSPILKLLSFFQKRIILNFHGSDLIFKNVFTRLLSIPLISLIRKEQIVVPSLYYKKKILDRYDIKSNKIFVYPSGGINTSIFYQRNYKSSDKFIVGFVSNFIENKGWKIMLLAIESILKRKSINNLEVIMIGDGPDRKEILSYLERTNVKSSVLSNVMQSKLALMYNDMNVFIFPTYGESLGLVGLEAMACGTPVIASNVGGPLGYIKHGINSFLFEKKNVDDLESKIVNYYKLIEKEKEFIINNAIIMAKNYDSKKVNLELLSFLKKC